LNSNARHLNYLTVNTCLVSKLYQSEELPNSIAFFHYKNNTTNLDTTPNLWTLHEPKNIEEGPNKFESKKNLLFRGTPIKQDKPELSAPFYAEQNPADQPQPHSYQLFVFGDYQFPVTSDIKPDPIGPIMTNPPIIQTQVVADKAKEYGMNKPTAFTGDRMKIRWFLQDCLGYLDMNQSIYNTDRLKIGFILSYMNDGEAMNWKEYYLDTLKDLNTEMPNFPTLVTSLVDI
jgi:hypothetical protein